MKRLPLLIGCLLTLSAELLATASSSPRERISLDQDWRFQLGAVLEAKTPDFNDTAWRVLDVPHDWSIEGDYSASNSSGDKCGWLPGGIGWYRREISVPATWHGKVVTLEFEGVYMNSEVWLNGEHVGGRPYGYSSFTCDLTAHLRVGRNVLAVRVDNSLEPSARWYHGCGIYGHVNLTVTDPVHIAKNGVFVTTPASTSENATVCVLARLAEAKANASSVTVKITLLDPSGKAVGTAISPELSTQSPTVFDQTLTVPSPQLWSLESPVLYTAVVDVIRSGQLIDSTRTPFGIRSLRFDANEGFFLNGKHLKIQGVCEHQGGSPVGAAMPSALLERRLRQLKAMGCNAIRVAHNPELPQFYDLCDRLGLLVMDEIFDGWQQKAEQDYGGRFFQAWWQRDVTDWVERNRNHPSIIFWSIGNETGLEDVHGITQLIHTLDDTRPTTGGAVIKGVDVAGFNGGIVPTDKVLEDFHRNNPTQPIVMTEEPHTFQTRSFYRTRNSVLKGMDPLPDYAAPEVFPPSHSAYRSSYDNCGRRLLIRNCWQRTQARPWVMGEFRWTGFDYLGEAAWSGKESLAREFNFGVIDLAGFPKDAYYLYQSLWTEKPMVHLLPDWTHPGLEGKTIPVVAYANADEIELFQDNQSLGRKKRSQLYECVWSVVYQPGELKAVAYREGKAVAETVQRSAGAPAKLKLTTDNANLQADRNDLALVTMAVCDERGVFNPRADNRIDLALLGPARWIGGDNGDPIDLTPQREMGRKVFSGLARGFFAGLEGKTETVEVNALGILGASYFDTSSQVTIAFERVALRGKLHDTPVEIRYTTDGSAPTLSSEKYTHPRTLFKTTTVRASVFRDGQAGVSSTATFTKGRPVMASTAPTRGNDMGAAEDPTQVKIKRKKEIKN